jgi:hypothetical protein
LLIKGFCTPVQDEPAYGCDESSMTACATAPGRTSPHCSGGACADGACLPDHLDCNGQASDGCEAWLLDPKTCGSCSTACAPGQVCRSTGCAAACGPLETQVGSSCVDTTTQCSVPCAPPFHGTAACSGATCTITCDAGHALCNGACVDEQHDPKHCGGCNACPSPPDGGAMACVAGTCTPSCPAGLTLCGNTCADLATSLDHCGACATPCTSGLCAGGTCDASLPRVLMSGVKLGVLAVDATTVFYADQTASTIGRVEKTGGPATVLATGESGVQGLAVDSAYVYWSSKTANVIKRVAKSGGTVQTVATATQPTVVQVDATDVFWANTASAQLLEAPSTGGGSTTVLGSVSVASVLADIAIDGTHAYWVAPSLQGGLFRTPKDGTGSKEASPSLNAWRIALDQDRVYVISDSPYQGLARQKKDFTGPAQRLLDVSGAQLVDALAVGSRYAYLHSSAPFNGTALSGKLLKCGGAFVAPACALPCFSTDAYGAHLVTDDTFVYGVANGALQRTPQ